MNKIWDWNKFRVVGAEFVSEEIIFEREDGERWVSGETLQDLDGHIFTPEIVLVVADLYPWI